MIHLKPLVGILAFSLIIVCLFPSAATAQGSTAYAIIEAVNALRLSRGLAPYEIDAGLMAYAQEHSDYQAAQHFSTHQHSDGTTSQQQGISENVASGDLCCLTPEFAVYTIWSDAIHMKTMVGFDSGYVGAGVADDGKTAYYTLNVRPGEAGSAPSSSGGSAQNPASSPEPYVPLATVTPQADGSIIHVVGYGQSLWAIAIAYGVKIDEIRQWNNLPADSTTITSGQKLLIRKSAVSTPQVIASPTLTITLTVLAASPSPEVKTPTSNPTSSPTTTTEPTTTPAAQSPLTTVGLFLVISGGLLAILILIFGWKK
jgi:LysM repeat protein